MSFSRGVLARVGRHLPEMGMGLGVSMVLIAGAVSFVKIQRMVESFALVEHTHEMRRHLNTTGSLAQAVGANVHDYVWTGEKGFVLREASAREELAQELALLRDLTLGQPLRERVDLLGQLVMRRLEVADETLRLRREMGQQAAVAQLASGEGLDAEIALRLAQMDEVESQLLAQGRAATETATTSSLASTVFLELLGVGILAGMISIGRRLNANLEDRVLVRTTELARTNQANRALELRYASVLDTMSDGAQIVDFEWTYLYLNEVAVKQARRPHVQLLGRRMMDVFPDIEHTELFEALRACMTTRTSQQIENRFEYDDGSCGYFQVNVTAVPEGIFILSQDITERRLAAKAVRDGHERFRDLVSRLNDVVWSASLDGSNILDINESFERVYGRSLEEFKSNPKLWFEMVHPDDRRIAEESAKQLGRDGEVSAEYRIVRPDGAVRWLLDRKSIVLDGQGIRRQLGGITSDITDVKRKEAIVRIQRDLGIALSSTSSLAEGLDLCLAAALDVSGLDAGGIYLLDEKSGVLDLICHRGLRPEFVAAVSRYEASSPNAKLVAAGKAIHSSFCQPGTEPTTQRGREANLRAKSVVPIWQGDRIIGSLNATSHSVDEIPRVNQDALEAIVAQVGNAVARLNAEESLCLLNLDLERQVRERTAEAESSNRAKGAFLAKMSHEIRTPMNAILGFAQLLPRTGALTTQQRKHVDTILRSGRHLLALITDILEYSKIEAGRVTVNNANFDLQALLNDLGVMFRLRTDAKNLSLLEQHNLRPLRYVLSDETKLRQILQNLLANAVKFTEKGVVALRTSVEPGPEAKTMLLVVEVEDSGPGIAPEEIGRLFQAFEQSEAGRRSQAGTGLGLAISREFAQLLGGTLKVRSQLGQGSLFRLELPIREGDRVPARRNLRRVTALEPDQATVRVLLADDNQDNRSYLEALLGMLGFDVRTVDDGAKALEEFECWRPQLVLMELQMPVMTGLEAIAGIRGLQGGKAVKIIVVTASAFGEDRQQAIAVGADDYISKPFQEQELFEKIQQLLGVRYNFAEVEEESPPSSAPSGAILRGQVATLPRDLVEQLRHAVRSADLDGIFELTGKIDLDGQLIAQEIRRLAAAFAYKNLLSLLESGKVAPFGSESDRTERLG